jgi:hypothetical protein
LARYDPFLCACGASENLDSKKIEIGGERTAFLAPRSPDCDPAERGTYSLIREQLVSAGEQLAFLTTATTPLVGIESIIAVHGVSFPASSLFAASAKFFD